MADKPFLQSLFEAPDVAPRIPKTESKAAPQAMQDVDVPEATPAATDTRSPSIRTMLPGANLRPMFEAAAREFDVPLNVLMALGHQESRYNPAAIGQRTEWGRAKGIMQYLDDTARNLGINALDPAQAIPAAAKQIRERLDKGYSMEDAVKEHFAGPDRKKWGSKTAAYGREVMEKVGRIGAELGDFVSDTTDTAGTLIDRLNKDEPGRYRQPTAEEIAAFEAGSAEPDDFDKAFAAQEKANSDQSLMDRFKDRAGGGWDQMSRSVGVAKAVLANRWDDASMDTVSDAILESIKDAQKKQANLHPQEKEIEASLDRFGESKGVLGTLKAAGDVAYTGITNPIGLGLGTVEQGANMLPTMAGGVGGAGTGAAVGAGAGALVGGVGAAPGAVAGALIGGRAGMATGTAVLEYGNELQSAIQAELEKQKLAPTKESIKKLLSDEGFRGEIEKQAAVKGLTLAAVDALSFGLAGRAASAPVRGAEKKAIKWLAKEQGVSEAAAKKLLGTEAGKAAVKEAAPSLGKRAAAGAGATGIELVGEPAGEAISQLAARGEIDKRDVAAEGLYGAATSGATAATAYGVERAGAAARRAVGPLTKSVEKAAENDASDGNRVKVQAADGEMTGEVQGVQEDGQGGFNTQILGDDGQLYNFNSRDGVQITPDENQSGPLTSAVESAAEENAAAAPARPVPQTGPAIWRNADSDLPVNVLGIEPEKGSDGRTYARVERDGQESFVPADELIPAPAQQSTQQQPAEDVAPAAEQATEPQKRERAPKVEADLSTMDEPALRARLKYIAEQAKASGGWNKMFVAERRRVEKAIADLKAAPKVETATETPSSFTDRGEANSAMIAAAEKTGLPHEVVERDGTFIIQPIQEAANEQRHSDVPGIGDVAAGRAENAAQDGADQSRGRLADQEPGESGRAVPGEAVSGAGPAVSGAGAAADRQPALSKDLAGAKPRYSYGSKQFDLQFASDIDRAAYIAAQKTPSKRDADYVKFVADATGMDEAQVRAHGAKVRDAIKAQAKDAEAGTLSVAAVHGAAEPSAQPAKPKTASKADMEHLFGVDKKRAAALDRIAKGRAWFGDKTKASEFIAKNGLTDTHTVEQTGTKRFEVKAKEQNEGAASNVSADLTGKDIDGDWAEFSADSGTLKVPRADMPQIKAEHRGAMVNFLNARDIAHEETEVPADSLKPTQAEFSRKKVEKAKGYEGGDRSILVSSDGHVLDGHHQWLAKREAGEPVKVIRLDAPISELLETIKEFPSATQADGATEAKPTAANSSEATSETARRGNYTLKSGERARVLEGATRGQFSVSVGNAKGENMESLGSFNMADDGTISRVASRANWAMNNVQDAAEQFSAEHRKKATAQAPTDPTPQKGGKKAYGSQNKLVSQARREEIKRLMRGKAGQLNSGIDPELMALGAELAVFHIEAGTRKFADFAKAMIEDIGEKFVPYVRSFYDAARSYPGLDTEGMTPYDEAVAMHQAMLTPQVLDEVSEAVGEVAAKPAKRTKKTGSKGDMVLTQDWGVEHINGYGDAERETGNDTKDAFLKETRNYLNAVSNALLSYGFTPHLDRKGKEEKPVSVNESGMAGSGDVTLTMRSDDGDVNIYVTIGDTALRGVVPSTPSGIAIMYRVGAGTDRYASKSGNTWAPVDLSAADFAMMLGEKAKRARVANPAPSPTMNAKEVQQNDTEPSENNARASDEGQAAEPARRDEGGRDADRVHESTGGDRAGTDGSRAQRTGERSEVPGDQRSDAEGAGSERQAEGGRGSSAATGDRGTGRTARVKNYRIQPGEIARAGSWRATAVRNVEIVELVKKIEAEGRQPTADERAMLTKFTGWGASEIANGIFPDQYGRYKNAEWQALGERLKAALTPAEYEQARRTTQYAHYTSEGVINSIYAGLDRMGFKGGSVVEPGMGIGLFNGLMPNGMAANSQYTGIEYDTITGTIAKMLYPESNVIVGDFTRTALPKDFFDAAIGNPPFSSTQVLNDPEYKSRRPMLHDYFFMKTVDRVKPGGLLVFVTSKGTMDKASDKSRKYLAERANLLGAIRLPQTAFKDNAGTEVVTDVIFLQKRGDGIPDNGVQWLGTKDVDTPQGKTPINEYFADHPEMVLGTHALAGSMYRANEYTVLPREGDIEAHFAEAIKNLPENVSRPARGSLAERAVVQDRDFNPNHKKEGGLYLQGEKLMQVEDGSGVALTHRSGADGKKILLTPKQIKWLKGYVGVRDALKQAQFDQLNDGDWEKSLNALNKTYDAFVKENGPILDYTTITRETDEGTVETKRLKNAPLFQTDVEGALVYALEQIKEDGTIVKGVALKERVLERPREPEIKTTNDAMFVSLNRHGTLNLDDVAALAGTTREAVIGDLGTAIFEAPGKGWQLADEYLSGNVVRKLKEAQAAAEVDPKYKRNIDALLAVQPRPLGPTEITVRMGANWVPASDIAAFAQEVIGDRMTVKYNSTLGNWSVDAHTHSASEYGFNKMSAEEILSAVLNSRQIKVTYRDQDGKTHVDLEATEKANDIASKMRDRFRTWIWTDAERADRLTKYYNENFNNIAPRKFDGSHLTLPGVSSRYKLHPHQKRAVWRVVQQGDTYLAHAVGAGKTIEMIAAGMEERRLGLVNKPMYVVPNHMLAQFSREFLELYPAANIMVADEHNFHTHNRRRFVAQAALNNPDAIVITHPAFGRIGMSDEYSAQFIQDQIDTWKETLDDVDKGDRITIKQIERRIEQLERRLEGKQGKDKKDQVLAFEELGVDRLYVDEFHEFRKLDFATNQGSVKGIDPNGSQRALDLYMKAEYLRAKKPGRALVAASGTPVTNTMGELFTAQRFFQPEQLKEDGLDTFDAWSAQYGDIVTGFEQNAAGGYEMVARFAKFQNVPELMRRVRSFMDILTASNLGALVKRPDVIDGGRQVVVTPVPDGYKEYQQSLQSRIKAIRARKGPPKKGEDIILNVIADGRFSAIDMRFVDPSQPSDPNSKLNRWIDDILAAYQETAGNTYSGLDGKAEPLPGSSIIGFTDIGLGEASAANRGFDMRAWIEKRLKDAGVPAEHIAFMRDYKQHAKKEKMFADMRAGKKRILIGGKEMETGVNVQKRLTHLFHLDAPWFPASVEQREGRIIRQGNQNEEVSIKAYATKGSYDSTMWGMNARKARFIEQAMNGDDNVRSLEDVSEASAFEMASALASGDERYLRLAGLKTDVERFERLRHAHYSDQNSMRREKHANEDAIERNTRRAEELKKAIEKRQPIKAGNFEGKVDGKTFDSREDFSMALFEVFKDMGDREIGKPAQLGEIGGFPIMFYPSKMKAGYYASLHVDIPGDPDPLLNFPIDPNETIGGIATRAANQINGMDRELNIAESRIAESKRKVEQIGKRLGAAFPEEAILMEKVAELNALQEELAAEGDAANADAAAATVEAEGDAQPEADDDGVRYSVAPDGSVEAEFGPVTEAFRDDPAGAIEYLMEQQTGEALINHPTLGEISLIYGDKNKGLAHIVARRGEAFLKRIPALLGVQRVYGKKTQRHRVFLGNEVDEATIRLDWNGQMKAWLLSAYEKYPDLQAIDAQAASRASVVAQRASRTLTPDGLRSAITKGVHGQIVRRMIDEGMIVLHANRKTLPKGLGKGVRGLQAIVAKDGTIHMVANALYAENALGVLWHEAFHEGAEKLIGSKEWAKLMARGASLYRQAEGSTGKAREFFDRARVRVAAAKKQGAVSTKMEVEEFLAYTIEEYANAPASFRKWVDDFIGHVKAWVQMRFGKQLGQVTPAQLTAIAKMALALTHPDAAKLMRPEKFSVAGITDTPAFRRWFGDSKVVDADGKPLVVYHGTASDFSVFNTGRGAIYFASDREAAQAYADYNEDGDGEPRVVEAYLRIEKPQVIDRAWADENMLDDDGAIDWTTLDNIAYAAEKKGHDGLILRGLPDFAGMDGNQRIEREYDQYIVFNSKQIKSATGNNGDFDPGNPDIRYSVAAEEAPASTTGAASQTAEGISPTAGFTPEEQGRLRKIQATFQDNLNRLKQVQDRIMKMTGREDLGAADYYGAEANRPGRIAARLEDMEKRLTGPLMARLAKSGHSKEQLSELLHAMHAGERNAKIAEFNQDMPDGGSGMTNAEADQIIAKYRGNKDLHAIAQQARDIARATLELKHAYGLIDDETLDTLTNVYENYVPLKGNIERGPKIKRAMGHDARDEMILENIARDHAQAVMVGEKNLARQSLLRMVLEFKDDSLWTARVPPRGRRIAGQTFIVKQSGKVVAEFDSLSQATAFVEGAEGNAEIETTSGERIQEYVKPLQDNEVMVYVKGEPIRLQFHDEKLASQLRPLDREKMNFVLEAMRGINRYLSKIYTGYNPAFMVKNTVRDAFTGSINMLGTQGATVTAKAWARYPSALRAMGQWAATNKAPDTKVGKYLNEYRLHGGKVGASYMSDLEQQGKSLQRLYDDAYGASGYLKDGKAGKAAVIAGRKVIGGMAHVIEIGNQATENAMRLALYATLRDEGVSPGKAAQAAKSVTVDFDRKGSATGVMSALYLFFNPAVQGTANAFKTLTQGKHKAQAWAALGGLTALGFYAASQGMDDDRDRWLGENWDIRSKTLVFNVGGKQIKIPMSMEFAPAYAFGVAMGEASRGENIGTSAVRVVQSFIDAYFPLSGVYGHDSDSHHQDVVAAVMPTVLKPGFESAFNRNRFGNQIVPESEFTKDRPDNLKMTRPTKGSAYDKTAQGIASLGEMMGAGKYENDMTKVSPETLKHFWRTYTGGLGTFIADSASMAGIAVEDFSQLEKADVPIVKDFVKDESVKPIRSRYYDLSKEARTAITEFDQAKKAGDGEALDKIFAQPGKEHLISLGRMVRSTSKAAAAMRDEAVDINADESMSLAEKRAALKELEAAEEELYRQALEAFRQ